MSDKRIKNISRIVVELTTAEIGYEYEEMDTTGQEFREEVEDYIMTELDVDKAMLLECQIDTYEEDENGEFTKHARTFKPLEEE